MRKIYGLLTITMLISTHTFGQENKDQGTFSDGLESTSQWYQSDKDLGFDKPSDAFRSNNYLRLDYTKGKFSAGLQYEANLQNALLGYSDRFNDNKIANNKVNNKAEEMEITVVVFKKHLGIEMI